MPPVWLRSEPVNESPAVQKRLLLVCNPIAGGGKGRVRGPELAAALAARGVRAECWFTSARGDAEARARAAGSEPWDGIVALGGDGTVNEVLNGMPDLRRPLGFFPLGTANVLACELGLPSRVDRAADALAAGHTRPLAVGRAADRRFLLFCNGLRARMRRSRASCLRHAHHCGTRIAVLTVRTAVSATAKIMP